MARPAGGRFALAPGVRGANAITTSLTFLLNVGSRPVPGQVWGRGMRRGFGLEVVIAAHHQNSWPRSTWHGQLHSI